MTQRFFIRDEKAKGQKSKDTIKVYAVADRNVPGFIIERVSVDEKGVETIVSSEHKPNALIVESMHNAKPYYELIREK